MVLFAGVVAVAGALVASGARSGPVQAQTPGDYKALVALFEQMRESQRAEPGPDGIVDYSPAAVTARRTRLDELGQSLDAIDSRSWPLAQRVDHLLVITQWRSFDFEHRVVHPWTRDPGFYVDMVQRVPFAELPASGAALPQLQARLRAVPKILEGARANLTQGAGELTQQALRNLEKADGVGHGFPYRATPPAGVIGWYDDLRARAATQQSDLVPDIDKAKQAVLAFRDWLVQHKANLNAPAGIGLDNYNYYQRYVRLMPFTADDNMRLGERELNRGRAFLAIERNKNRNLPPLLPSASEEEYARRKQDADREIREFIQREAMLTIPAYVKELDTNVPWIVRPGGKRNFWEEIQYRDPRPDHLHAVIPGHRFDGMLHREDKRPIRGRYSDGGRTEGWGFYLEEAFLQAGLLDKRPRTKELFYLFQIKRAARVRAEVKMHANEFTVADAVKSMMDNVEFLDEDVARVDAEIYLRRAGYGSGYQMGKLQMDQLLSDRYHQLGAKFSLKEFHDQFLAAGTIPISVIRWEMTGFDNEVRDLWTRRVAGQSTRR
jgi:uncharacterized protein (DUF885 family)